MFDTPPRRGPDGAGRGRAGPRLALTVLLALTLLAPGPAAAQLLGEVTGTYYTLPRWPRAATRRPLTLAQGMVQLDHTLFVNVGDEFFGEPVSYAPRLHVGVTPFITVGVIHGKGICFTGESGCASTYNDLGLDSLFSFVWTEHFQAAFRLTLAAGAMDLIDSSLFLVPGWDPFGLILRPGVVSRLTLWRFAFWLEVALRIGLANRDAGPFGNREYFMLPAWLGFQLTEGLMVYLRAGLNAPLDFPGIDMGQSYQAPLGWGLLYSPVNWIDLRGTFAFGNLYGQNDFPGALPKQAVRLLFFSAVFRF